MLETLSTNFKPMSQYEFIVGYERMVGANWSVGMRGVLRSFNEVIEDFTIDPASLEKYGFVDES